MEEELQQGAPAKKKRPRLDIQPQTLGELLLEYGMNKAPSPVVLGFVMVLTALYIIWCVLVREPTGHPVPIFGVLTFVVLVGAVTSLRWKTVHRVFWRLLEEGGTGAGLPGKPYPNPTGLPKVDIQPQNLAERWVQYRANASRSLTWPMSHLLVAIVLSFLCLLFPQWQVIPSVFDGSLFATVFLVFLAYCNYYIYKIMRRLVEARDAAAATESEKASAGEGPSVMA